MIGQICDWIVLIGGVCFAIERVYNFFAKPTKDLKKKAEEAEKARIQEVVKEMLPQYLHDHDLETRDKYKSDRMNYLNEIKAEVLKEVGADINENNDTIEALRISARDVLREKIMAIYHKNKTTRTMSEYEREALTQYYKDYKALKGNSYIDKRYSRMEKWDVVYDEDLDDDEE